MSKRNVPPVRSRSGHNGGAPEVHPYVRTYNAGAQLPQRVKESGGIVSFSDAYSAYLLRRPSSMCANRILWIVRHHSAAGPGKLLRCTKSRIRESVADPEHVLIGGRG